MEPVTRISRSFANYCLLVMHSHKKKLFVVEERYYAAKVYLVLYKCVVKETVPKCGGLVDFSTNSVLTMHADTHAHHCCLF